MREVLDRLKQLENNKTLRTDILYFREKAGEGGNFEQLSKSALTLKLEKQFQN